MSRIEASIQALTFFFCLRSQLELKKQFLINKQDGVSFKGKQYGQAPIFLTLASTEKRLKLTSEGQASYGVDCGSGHLSQTDSSVGRG